MVPLPGLFIFIYENSIVMVNSLINEKKTAEFTRKHKSEAILCPVLLPVYLISSVRNPLTYSSVLNKATWLINLYLNQTLSTNRSFLHEGARLNLRKMGHSKLLSL